MGPAKAGAWREVGFRVYGLWGGVGGAGALLSLPARPWVWLSPGTASRGGDLCWRGSERSWLAPSCRVL